MKNISNIKPLLVQQHNLKNIFDLSSDYFKDRINIDYFIGVHFFPQEPKNKNKKTTKHAVLWDISMVEKVLKNTNNQKANNIIDPEVAKLLERR